MAIIPFGKYKGKTIGYVYNNDIKYYKWLKTIPLKGQLKQNIEDFEQNLAKTERDFVLQLLEKAKKYREQGELVYYINIHCVGDQYQIKDINTENILNRSFYINCRAISKDNFKILEDYLYEENKKLGSPSKSRGLY